MLITFGLFPLFLKFFFLLAIGHAVADYALQTEYMSRAKARKSEPQTWFWVLGAHALVHAGMVYLITGSTIFAFAEFTAHFVIDYFKSEGKYGYHTDQVLHYLCKVLWVGLMMFAL
jgi:hypothetical protein